MLRNLIAIAIALFYSANGSFMLLDPAAWYAAVPGVSGPMNAHFIRDIGFIYLLSALALLLATRRPRQFALWAGLGTAWPALHALFHLGEWWRHGLSSAAVCAAEIAGVFVPVVVGALLVIGAARGPHTLNT